MPGPAQPISKFSKYRSAFTLIELLVVVAIISLLAAIASVNYRMVKYRAKLGKALSDMHSIKTSLEAYRIDQGQYPPDIDGFMPFILTDSLSRPIAYISDNRAMHDPLNDLRPKPDQWRFQTYRYVNIQGRLRGMPGLNSNRSPNDWLPIRPALWKTAQAKYGDYLLAAVQIKYKDNFKRDEAGRSKAMLKWNEFYWKEEDGAPGFMNLKHDPIVSQKITWSGMDVTEEDEDEEGVYAR